jgi:hypothetical protein
MRTLGRSLLLLLSATVLAPFLILSVYTATMVASVLMTP